MARVPSSQTRILRAGVVGIGAFGRHHAAKYSKLAGVELVGVADPSADARRTHMAAHGVPAFSDWRELLGMVDVVSVCSPAVTHAPIVRAFLNANTDVLVEKPIAINLDEADSLIALAEVKNRVLTVGHQERYVFARTGLLSYPDAPLEVECWRTGPWTGRGADVSAVLDLMIHDLDLVHRLIPHGVADVQARSRTVQARHPDEVSTVVSFENGSQARLVASRVSPIRRRGMRAVYDDGVIEIDFITRQVRNTTKRLLSPPQLEDPLGESIAGFVEAARIGAASLVRPEEARRALETALLIDEACAPLGERRSSGEFALHA
ncbi:MAG: Gfo/Idh/MocA family oxidoreductase [Proteobacteria bacterium]|nr:Gfo/Idh/MocA family oxidoreductase [Pseudomonadota bacterium]